MKKDDCIEWEGRRRPSGYGVVGAKNKGAHRIAYEEAHGPIPEGMIIMHTCDNPPCVNPAHLVAGTHLDNVRDCINKGRRRYPNRDTLRNAKLTSAKLPEVVRLREAGWSIRRLAERYGVSVSTLHDFLCSRTVTVPKSGKVVGVLGFEPRAPSSRTRRRGLNARKSRENGANERGTGYEQ